MIENTLETQWQDDTEMEPARAPILHSAHVPTGDAKIVQLMLVLEVRLRGYAPYQTAISRVVATDIAGRLEAGKTLDVRVSPLAPTNVYIDLHCSSL